MKAINVRCPKCGGKDLWAYEETIAESGHHFVDGVWDHSQDFNEYGDVFEVNFRCTKCGHRWKGRKGPTILDYIDRRYLDPNDPNDNLW